MLHVQRKTIGDLLRSLADGRLARELPSLQASGRGVLLVEGRPHWTSDGVLIDGSRPTRGGLWSLRGAEAHMTRDRWYGIQADVVWVHGIAWIETADVDETAAWLRHVDGWLARPHRGLVARPAWSREQPFAAYLLQSFPGIGPEVAQRIVDTLGMPLRLACTEEDLASVPGVGPVRARAIAGALEQSV